MKSYLEPGFNQQNFKGEMLKRWSCSRSVRDSDTRGPEPGDVMESDPGGNQEGATLQSGS